MLVTRKDLPAANLQEFIAYAKANQDKMQFASASAGSATHLGCALLNAAIGVNVTHIPYRGGGPAMQDIVAGRVDYICIDTPSVISLIESGQIKAMAVLSGEPHGELAQCADGAGAGACRFRGGQLGGVLHAQGHARADRRRSSRPPAPRRPSSRAVQKRMKEIGVDPVAPERRSPEYLATFVEAEIAKWAGPVKASGLATD